MKKRNFITVLIVFILMLSFVTQVAAQSTFDTDGDGVPNTNDRCPNRPGPRANDGCPLSTPEPDNDNEGNRDIPPDSDGDGTADPLDACPSVPGDGANGGCPPGTDPNNPDGANLASSPAIPLLAAPDSNDCIISPEGEFGVNIRIAPNPTAAITHVLQVNEWATVLAISYEGPSPLRAQHEFGGDVYEPELDFIAPGPDDGPDEDDSLWLMIETDDGIFGWVAEDVIRKAGDCSEFVLPPDDPDWLEVLILPNDGGHTGFPNASGFLQIPIFPDPPPGLQFDLVLPEEDDDDTLDLIPECIWVDMGNGASLLECADGSTPIFIYCLIEPGSEAGIFEENCYEVEVPEGCTVTTAEAGVWTFDCEGDGGVIVTPFGNDNPIFKVEGNDQGIAMLLPAVQAAREAAR